MRQQGAWKCHPYNSVAQNCLLLPFWLKFKNLEDHAVAANTQPTDILAFTVTSLTIHTCSHTCTHQLLSGIPKDIFLHLTGPLLQQENIQFITKLSPITQCTNIAHLRITLR